MKSTLQITVFALLIAGLSSACQGQSGTSHYDPVPRQKSSATRNSFLSFTLGRINPEDADYGQCLSEGRKWLLDETVKTGYFWSNLIALTLLTVLFVAIVYQHKVSTKQEWATAEVLAQYELALARSNALLNAAVLKNRELAKVLAALKESSARFVAPAVEPAESIVASSAKIRAGTAKITPQITSSAAPIKANDGDVATAALPAQPANQWRLFAPEVDLIVKLNSLEQQLAHAQRDNSALRRRIADGESRVQSGKEPNSRLEGAQQQGS